MCHLTEIPPMRRIDLQPDVRGQKCAMLCGWLGQSVPIHEIVDGVGGSVARRRIVSVAWRNLFIAETAGAGRTRHRKGRDKYGGSMIDIAVVEAFNASCKVDRDHVQVIS